MSIFDANESVKNFNKVRRVKEQINFSVTRYRANGQPTCFSWAGGSEATERQVCIFYTNSKAGSSNQHCLLLDKPIYHTAMNEFMTPLEGCPLWKEKTIQDYLGLIRLRLKHVAEYNNMTIRMLALQDWDVDLLVETDPVDPEVSAKIMEYLLDKDLNPGMLALHVNTPYISIEDSRKKYKNDATVEIIFDEVVKGDDNER